MSDEYETAAQRMQARRDWHALREEDRVCEHCGFHSPMAMICDVCEAYSKGVDAGIASAESSLATSTALAAEQAAEIERLKQLASERYQEIEELHAAMGEASQQTATPIQRLRERAERERDDAVFAAGQWAARTDELAASNDELRATAEIWRRALVRWQEWGATMRPDAALNGDESTRKAIAAERDAPRKHAIEKQDQTEAMIDRWTAQRDSALLQRDQAAAAERESIASWLEGYYDLYPTQRKTLVLAIRTNADKEG